MLGGAYAADLTSSSWVAGSSTSFTRIFALEAMFGYALALEVINIIEERQGTDLVRDGTLPVWLYQGHLVWTLAYGKLRWFGSRSAASTSTWP